MTNEDRAERAEQTVGAFEGESLRVDCRMEAADGTPQGEGGAQTFSVLLTWDNFPEGGTFGVVVQASSEENAEELARLEMASVRAGESDSEEEHAAAVKDAFDSYADDWHVVEVFRGDIWALAASAEG